MMIFLLATLLSAAALLARLPSHPTDGFYVHKGWRDSLLLSSTLPADTVSVVVFANNYTCAKCYKSIADVLDSIQKTRRVHTAVLLRGKASSVSSLKVNVSEAFPRAPLYYELITDPWPPINPQGGYFGYYNTSKTPSVLFVFSEKHLYLPYEDLFEEDDLLTTVRTAINTLTQP